MVLGVFIYYYMYTHNKLYILNVHCVCISIYHHVVKCKQIYIYIIFVYKNATDVHIITFIMCFL